MWPEIEASVLYVAGPKDPEPPPACHGVVSKR